MPIHLDDAEPIAQRELRLAHLDGHDSPPWRTLLARRGVRVARFGTSSPIYRRSGVGTHGLVKDQPTAYVWDGLNEHDTAYTACHEWGHLLVADGLELACPMEAFCNRFAAAVLTPADSAQRAWRKAPRDLLALHALRPQTSTSVLTMRIGELGLSAIALYDRKRIRYAIGVQQVPRGVGKLVELARREGFAENENGRAWVLPDNEARVSVLLAA